FGTVGALKLKQNVPIRTLVFSPNPVVGGQSSTATLTLNGPAPDGGQVVKLFVTNSAFVPATVLVPAGENKVSFTIRTMPVDRILDTFVTAGINSEGLISPLTLTPN